MEIWEIVRKIKQKKELAGIADFIVLESLEKQIRKKNIELHKLKKREEKELVASVRAELRNYSGRFDFGAKEREKMLEKGDFIGLLKSHSSTRERIDFYPELKKRINALGARSILDLGCGLNPIALGEKGVYYYAIDIKEDELKLINRFFEKSGILGETRVYDLRKIKENELPSADLCLILKVFDVLEKRGHKLAERILKSINCKRIIISFATRTLSGKMMGHPQRGWIERLLTRLGLKFEVANTREEIYYFVKNHTPKVCGVSGS